MASPTAKIGAIQQEIKQYTQNYPARKRNDLEQKIQTLITQANSPSELQKKSAELLPSLSASTKIEAEIEALATQISTDSRIPPQEKSKLKEQLIDLRSSLIENHGRPGCLDMNVIQNIPSTPINPAYNNSEIFIISNYHYIASFKSRFRLDPACCKEMLPEKIQELLKRRQYKEIDLFLTVINATNIYSPEGVYNLATHYWTHRDILPGWDVNKEVQMGIYPITGVNSLKNEPGAIAFDSLSPMGVHSHPAHNAPGMLYSPDNAHFFLDNTTPFSVFWAVGIVDDRFCATKMVIVKDRLNPISPVLLDSQEDCFYLKDYLEKQSQVSKAIEVYLSPIAELFATDERKAMEAFHNLPLTIQHVAYKNAWTLKECPQGIDDFGRLSFEGTGNLNEEQRCSSEEKFLIMQMVTEELKEILVGSSVSLLRAQSLTKPQKALELMKAAASLQDEREPDIKRRFEQLNPECKDAAYRALWELNGCPRINDYSTAFFDSFPTTLKAQALLLAASRFQTS